MKRRIRTALLITTLILLGVIVLNGGKMPLTLVFDDYGIYDDFNAGISEDKWKTQEVIEQEGKLVFNSLGGEQGGDVRTLRYLTSKLETKENLEGNDVQFLIENQFYQRQIARNTPCQYQPLLIKAGSCQTTTTGSDTLIQIFTSDLNNTYAELWKNGQRMCSFDPRGYKLTMQLDTISVGCSGYYRIDEVKMRKRFNAAIDPATEALYHQTFTGPAQVGLTNFNVPVKSFTLKNPVLIASSTEKGISSSAEPLVAWSKLQTLTIPQGEVWQVYYVADKIYNTKNCEFAYDAQAEMCVSQIQLVNSCSQGMVYDPVLQNCISSTKFACNNLNGTMIGEECKLSNTQTPANYFETSQTVEITRATTQNNTALWAIGALLIIILAIIVKRRG